MTRSVNTTLPATNANQGSDIAASPSGRSEISKAVASNTEDDTAESSWPTKTETTEKPAIPTMAMPARTEPTNPVVQKEPGPVVTPKVEKPQPIQTFAPASSDPGTPLGPKMDPEIGAGKNEPVTKSVSETPAASVMALAAQPLFNPQLLIIIGAAFLAGALALLFMVFRRLRKLPEPSIITRSMEQR